MKTELFLESRPLLLDIETDSLRADYGLILCVVVRPYGAPTKEASVYRIDIRRADLEVAERIMLKKLRERLDAATGVIHFNGTKFDIPFLQARFGMQGIRLLPKLRQLDVFSTMLRVFPGFRGSAVITSRRMAAIEELLHEGDPKAPMKHGVSPHNWRRAKFARSTRAMNEIVDHCVKDIDVLEYQVRRFRDLLPQRVVLR